MDQEKIAQKTVVVLGAAKSGKSVMAGILASLGVDMGPTGGPDRSNPRGSFEDKDFADLHKEIFERAGKGKNYWDPPSLESILALKDEFASKIQELSLRKSRDKTVWGWNHPRTILTAELFLPYLNNPHFIVVFRNPVGTANSSVQHTEKYQDRVHFLQALKLTNFYYGEILKFLEMHPNLPRSFIAFEELVDDPLREARKLAEFLGLEMSEETTKDIHQLVIPREKVEMERKKATDLFTGKIPRLIKQTLGRAWRTRGQGGA